MEHRNLELRNSEPVTWNTEIGNWNPNNGQMESFISIDFIMFSTRLRDPSSRRMSQTRICNLELGTWNSELGTWNSVTWNSVTWHLELGNLEFGNPEHGN